MSATVKTVFTTLFFVIISIFALTAWLIFQYPSPGHIIVHNLDDMKRTARIEVTTQRADLEKIINGYMHKHVKSDGLTYKVTLTDDLRFDGDAHIFGLKVPVSVGFNPILQANGDLVLEQRYFRIGALSLPANLVLEYINRSYYFPEWIVLQPIQKKVYLSTTNLGAASSVQIHVQEFDLTHEQFRFDVYLPGD
jgi:uncharacterized protein YpmS